MRFDGFINKLTALNNDSLWDNNLLLDRISHGILQIGSKSLYSTRYNSIGENRHVITETLYIIGLEEFKRLGKLGPHDFSKYETTYDFVIDYIKNDLGVSEINSLGIPSVVNSLFRCSPVISTLTYTYQSTLYKIIFCLNSSHYNTAKVHIGNIFSNNAGNIALDLYLYMNHYDRIFAVAMTNALFISGTFEDLTSIEDFAKFKKELKTLVEKKHKLNYDEFSTYYTRCIRNFTEGRTPSSISERSNPPIQSGAQVASAVRNAFSGRFSNNYQNILDFEESHNRPGTLSITRPVRTRWGVPDGVIDGSIQDNPSAPENSVSDSTFIYDEDEYEDEEDNDDNDI